MVWIVVDKIKADFAKSLVKVEKVKTDNIVFRLHYKLSIWLVIFYSICYFYVAWTNPIGCLGDCYKVCPYCGQCLYNSHELAAVNDYCFVHGTYLLPNVDPNEQIYPGIGRHTIGNADEELSPQFYKYMYFYIMVMMVLLVIPRHIWYSIENGLMRCLVGKLNKVLILSKDEEIDKEKSMLVEYLTSHLGYHRRYSYGMVFCELLNVLVSFLIMGIWNFIANYEFSMHAAANWGYLWSKQGIRTDGLAMAFPFVGKCTFNKVGPSGNIQPLDFICVLPLNVINEKAAIFFWYFFMFLAVVGAVSLAFRLAIISSKRFQLFLLSDLTPITSLEDIEFLTEKCSYADWFVIYKMGSNLEPMVFRQILQQFIRKLKGLRAINRV